VSAAQRTATCDNVTGDLESRLHEVSERHSKYIRDVSPAGKVFAAKRSRRLPGYWPYGLYGITSGWAGGSVRPLPGKNGPRAARLRTVRASSSM
jgi:hypothetical protein